MFRTNNYLENFHHLLNAAIEVYHPKVSYLIYKYKEYLITIYRKVKESLVKNTKIVKNKFSVVDDVLMFISEYNKKYKTKLNIHKIIQSDQDELELINKISDYLLNLIFGIEKKDLENDENSQINIEYNDSIDISNEEGDDSSNEDNENRLYVDEFQPKIINNKNYKKKEII